MMDRVVPVMSPSAWQESGDFRLPGGGGPRGRTARPTTGEHTCHEPGRGPVVGVVEHIVALFAAVPRRG